MKLKLNDEQLQAMFNYFEHNVIGELPENDLEAIAQELLCDIFLKMDKRLKTRYRKNSDISLTRKECIVFRWHFNTYWVEEGWLYETNVARRLIAQIDPKLIF